MSVNQAYQRSPEELQQQHPYLSMSQAHSALAYYWDYQQELDADIDRREQYMIQAEQEAAPSPVADKLRAGELPPLTTVWQQYLRRFAIDHWYRFAKQRLHWTLPPLSTPEQSQRSS